MSMAAPIPWNERAAISHSALRAAPHKSEPTVKKILVHVLGLTLVPLHEDAVEMTPEIKELVERREQARKEKRWDEADAIRDKLKALGFEVQDKKL